MINKSEAKDLFNFLNLFLKLSDHCILGNDILNEVMVKADNTIKIILKEDLIDVTLTFDR